MEEIITVDGKQFKLTVDRPLSAQEKAQVLTEIRKQTGCGTCGPKTAQPVKTMDPNWQYGGRVRALPFDPDVTGTGTGPKGSGDTVTLTANPLGGVAPYDVRFWRANDGTTLIQTGIVNPNYLASPENTPVAATYIITDADVAAATGNGAATEPTAVNTGTGVITLGGAVAALAAGSIRFFSSIVDSCTGSGGRGTCAQYADVTLACVSPTCNFVVT